MGAFRWEQAAVAIVMHWAKTEGLRAVHIEKGSVVRVLAGTLLTEEQAFNRYDKTAQNMGFVYNEETGTYVFDLRHQGL